MVKQSFPAQVHHHFTEDIQTRQYRSLEVLLGGIESGIKMFQWIINLKTWTRQARVTEPQLTFGPRHAWRLSSLLVRIQKLPTVPILVTFSRWLLVWASQWRGLQQGRGPPCAHHRARRTHPQEHCHVGWGSETLIQSIRLAKYIYVPHTCCVLRRI